MFVAGIRAVGVDSEDEVALAIVDGEAVAGEEQGGFHDGEMGGGAGDDSVAEIEVGVNDGGDLHFWVTM